MMVQPASKASSTTYLLMVSPLAVDLVPFAGHHHAVLGEKHIPLTQKELQLLGCFALFAGRRLNCEEIYRHACTIFSVLGYKLAVYIDTHGMAAGKGKGKCIHAAVF